VRTERRTSIAVCDPSPTFRRGLAGILRDAGHHAVEPPDLTDWIQHPCNSAVVFTVEGVAPLDTVTGLVERRPDLTLVTLLPALDGEPAAAALRAGASAVAYRDDDPARIVAIVEHALAGDALLSVELARFLSHSPPVSAIDLIGLTRAELEWIRRLAKNDSIASIATDEAVSERTMYRRLDQTFRRIGVTSRLEAATWAIRNGHLDA
jgi:DNA-binding NarL/FixJ family response regulator